MLAGEKLRAESPEGRRAEKFQRDRGVAALLARTKGRALIA
jgi:hypothetical protein